MDILGYLITMVNLQHFENSGGPLKNLSVKVAEMQTLYSELLEAGLDLNRFKETGYYRYHDVGKYLSKNLREYMFDGLGKPEDEGVILTLYFDENSDHGLLNDDDTLSLFLHKDNVGSDVKEQVQEYLDNRFGREKRSLNRLVAQPVN